MMLRTLLLAVALCCALMAPAYATPPVTVTATTWVQIAAAGSTVEVQNLSTANVRLSVSASAPATLFDGEVMDGISPIRKFDAALPNPLWAIALNGPSATIAVNLIGAAGGTTSIKPSVVTMTTTEVSVPATTGTLLLAANVNRRYAQWCNDGTATARYGYGAAPTASTGVPLDPGSAAYRQGGCQTLESSAISGQAIYAYSTAGTTFAVTEGQ